MRRGPARNAPVAVAVAAVMVVVAAAGADAAVAKVTAIATGDSIDPPGRRPGLEKLPGIEDPGGIQRFFDAPMQRAHFFRSGQGPPRLFCETDAVFSRNGAFPGKHLPE